MRYHLGEGEYASLKFSEGTHSFSLDILLVPTRFRGQGIGEILLSRLLQMADATGKEVRTKAHPLGKNREEALQRLIAYYGKFGFVVEDREQTFAFMLRPESRRDCDAPAAVA
ncbi:MAG: GNAT family N-acetyltransferase [Sulfuritalea sp.]|nr:GNAT family N-acetyltransferase [Sulfuritalea sp.]MDP1984925.1 GNAT family N-acetyltransferase [Sulfuritalea sp.]